MTWQNWLVAAMLAVSFVDRMMNIVSGSRSDKRGELTVAAIVLVMCWYGALVMVLHSGSFW